MTPEEHRQRHIELHRHLDELLADWIAHDERASIRRPIEDLMQWSYTQTLGQSQPTSIILNGKQMFVASDELTYGDVIELALGVRRGLYTVTYRHGHGEKPEGTLAEGETVKVKDGTIFNVTRTDNA